MKARLIYVLDWSSPYRCEDIEVAKSGKWLDMEGWKPRIGSITWGAASAELVAEAKAINALQDAISARRKTLNARLRATQAAVLKAAAKAPMSPKAEAVSIKLRLTEGML